MSSPILTNVNTLISRADGYASKGTIDPTSNMADDKVYIFAGKSDTVVSPSTLKLKGLFTVAEHWVINNIFFFF